MSDQIFDTKEIFSVLWSGKKKIITVTIIASIISIAAALMITNVYRSEAILAPATKSSELSKLANQYAGIASVAGISLPGGDDSQTNVINGIEILRSFDFFEEFIGKHDLSFLLMAPNGWNKESNTLRINKKIYNISEKKWVSKIQYSIDGKPTTQTIHRYFHKELFSVSRDIKTGLVTITFDHYSPFVAQQILELIIEEINEISRNEAITRASKSIEYLEEEIKTTQLKEVRNGLNGLIQSQIETIMIAKSTPEHLFKILSPPIASELKIKPKRSLICIIGFFIGAFLGAALVILQHYFLQPKNI